MNTTATTRSDTTAPTGDRRVMRPQPASTTKLRTSDVICGAYADIDELAQLMAFRLHDNPTSRWLVPAIEDRTQILHDFYAVLAEQALAHGYVDVLADRSAAAVWLDRTQAGSMRGLGRRLAAACGPYGAAAMTLHATSEHHRPGFPHLHLAALAIAEPRDGAALLDHRLGRVARTGVATYAEADTDDHFGVLLAAGFQPRRGFRPGGAPVIYPMLHDQRMRNTDQSAGSWWPARS